MNTENRILKKFIRDHNTEVLNIIESFEIDDIASFLESIPLDWASLLVSRMDRQKAVGSIEKISNEFAVKLFEVLPVNHAITLLRSINNDHRESILGSLPDNKKQNLQNLLSYSKNMVGAYMDSNFFSVFQEFTIKETIDKIKKVKPSIQSEIIVVDRDMQLSGHILIKELINENKDASIRSIINPNPKKIIAEAHISVLTDKNVWPESISELIVVNTENIVQGVITKELIKTIDNPEKPANQNINKTGAALGELYKIGLASFIRGAAELSKD